MAKTDFDFSGFFERAKDQTAFHAEGLILEFTEEMVRRMEELSLSKSDLARRLDTSPAYITKLLRGTSNFTVETMVKVASALECEVRLKLQPEGAHSNWFDIWENSLDAVSPQEPVNWVSEEAKYQHRTGPHTAEETDEVSTAA